METLAFTEFKEETTKLGHAHASRVLNYENMAKQK